MTYNFANGTTFTPKPVDSSASADSSKDTSTATETKNLIEKAADLIKSDDSTAASDKKTGNSTETADDPVSSACFGVSAVLRMTFALFLFHLLILLLIIPRGEVSAVIHDGFWCCKFLLMLGTFIAFFFIHIDVFDVWMEICRFVSICFLFLQVLYIVTGSFSFNDYMKLAYSDNEGCGNWFLLIYAVILNVGALAITSLSFAWFIGPSDESENANNVSCSNNFALIIATYVFIGLSLLFGLLRLRPDATIFTSGLVNFWMAFLLWSGLAGQPDTCNTLQTSSWVTVVQIIAWLIFTFFCLLAVSIASKGKDGNKEEGTSAAADLAAQDGDAQEKAKDIEMITHVDKDGRESVVNGSEVYVFPVTI